MDKKQFSTVYSEQCQTSKMELFVKIVNGFQALAIFAKKASSWMFVRILVLHTVSYRGNNISLFLILRKHRKMNEVCYWLTNS